MEMARQLRQSCHFSDITISDWFEMVLVSNSIIVISKVDHTWIIFPRSGSKYLFANKKIYNWLTEKKYI